MRATDDLLNGIRSRSDMPRHVAIIMDGNGRWARGRHMPRVFGHRSGMSAVREVIEGAAEAGIQFLSLFAVAMVLFVLTFALNIASAWFVRRYRQAY